MWRITWPITWLITWWCMWLCTWLCAHDLGALKTKSKLVGCHDSCVMVVSSCFQSKDPWPLSGHPYICSCRPEEEKTPSQAYQDISVDQQWNRLLLTAAKASANPPVGLYSHIRAIFFAGLVSWKCTTSISMMQALPNFPERLPCCWIMWEGEKHTISTTYW